MIDVLLYVENFVNLLVRCILVIVKYGQKQTIPPATNEILLMSATSLASNIRSGKLTSQKVVQTYIERIKEVQPYIKGLAEDRFDLAIEEAKKIDELIESRKMTIKQIEEDKPLLGVPFIVKSMIAVEGMGFSGCCTVFKNRKAECDSDIVKRLKRSGAVLLGTSNMPELTLNAFSSNKLYGQVKNPHDTRMFVGNSSSGDAALNSVAAIPFGIANDYFGSVRKPCLLCGIFGHRYTCGMVPHQILLPQGSERVKRKVVTCPTSRHAEDLVTVMKAILGPKGKELGLGDSVDFSKLTIYYTHSFPKRSFGMPNVDDDVLWTILRVTNYFKQKFGSKVEYIDIDELTYASEIGLIESKLGFDNSLGRMLSMSGKFSSAKLELLKSMFGKSNMLFFTLFMYMAFQYTTSSYRDFSNLRSHLESLRDKLENLFQGQSILLYPTFPKKYIYTEENLLNMKTGAYCSIFTFLEIPITQCPVGYCDEGFPLGLQVMAGKYQDNLTLSVAAEIEKGFGKEGKLYLKST